jgi:hypothetical protein
MIRTVLVMMVVGSAVDTPGCDVLESCNPRPGNATSLNVSLTDGPTDGFRRVDIDVQAVEIHMSTQGWLQAAKPDRVVNLLALTGGMTETLAAGQSIGAGQYEEMRLILGTRNSVTLADGTVAPLDVPSAFNSGVKMPLSFTVAAGTTKDVFIDFDALSSVHLKKTGGAGKYVLRPVVRAFDKIVTGSVSGTLLDKNGAPIAGAIVTAQTESSAGDPSVQRLAISDKDGKYQLDLLPVNLSYFIVSQPVIAGVSYAATASGAIALTTASPTQSTTLTTDIAAATGAITASISPTATDAQADVATAIGVVSGKRFVLRTETPVIDGNNEGLTFDTLPTGSYDVVLSRSTFDTTGAVSGVDGARSTGISVAAGATSNVALSLH